MKDIVIAFLTVFMAEMGDKTQLLALAFSTKYKVKQVLLGVFIGAFLNHGIAIVFASFIAKYAPVSTLKLVAAIMFIAFGLASLKLDYQEEEEDEEPKFSKYGAIISVAGAFFLGELGDKTQLAAMTVAIQSDFPFLVLIGTTSAMVVVSFIGILVGKLLGKKIPEVTMKLVASGIFLIFGFTGLYSNLPPKYFTPLNVILFLGLIFILMFFIIRKNIHNKNKLNAAKLAQLINHCKECAVHSETCPIGIQIQETTKTYLGQDIPYLGKVITLLESMNKINPKKCQDIENFINQDLQKKSIL